MNSTVAHARSFLDRARAAQPLFEARCARLRSSPFYPDALDRERADEVLDLAAVVIDCDPSPASCCAGLADRAEVEGEASFWQGLSVELARRGHA